MTEAELQAALIANSQTQAANTVALIQSIVDGRMNIHEVDFNELEAKVTAVNDLLDGDTNSEGFQTFVALVARMTAVETENAAQATAIANLQTLVNSEVSTLNARVDTVDAGYKAADDALDGRVTTLEGNATASATARLTKDNEHDGKIATLEATASNTTDALTSEATARVQGDQANADAVNVQKARVDTLQTQANTFVNRDGIGGMFAAGVQAGINTLWAGRTRPAGLPNTDGSVSA